MANAARNHVIHAKGIGWRTNGRLEAATRYNFIGSPFNATVAVTETWAYGGRQGRASSRTTQMIFNGTPSEAFTQSWTWNALGDLGSLSYPQCVFAGCAPGPRTEEEKEKTKIRAKSFCLLSLACLHSPGLELRTRSTSSFAYRHIFAHLHQPGLPDQRAALGKGSFGQCGLRSPPRSTERRSGP